VAIGERPAPRALSDLLAPLSPETRLVVLEGVGNADNMGGIFRNAAAFGAAGVVLGPRCCDPLYRKAIRVSMGAALRVPFASAEEGWPGALRDLKAEGFSVLALTPSPDATGLAEAAAVPGRRLAVLAGAEGYGLTGEALAASDVAVRIPMAPGTDSLNVATAVGIALHHLFARS
jgi:tRNA G18 (ribose-2'-O)-methylase SpoU